MSLLIHVHCNSAFSFEMTKYRLWFFRAFGLHLKDVVNGVYKVLSLDLGFVRQTRGDYGNESEQMLCQARCIQT